MAYLPLLDAIIREQDQADARLSENEIAALLAGDDDEKRIGGFLFRACELFRAGHSRAALDTLIAVRETMGFVPLPVIANIIWLCRQMGLEQRAAHECLLFARDTCAMGHDDLALEAASAALIFDTLGGFEIIRNPRLTFETVQLYETIAARHIPVTTPAPCPAAKPNNALVNVAMVMPNLVDYIVAHTQMVLHFARYTDISKFRFWVYSTENFSIRAKPMFPFGAEKYITEQTGAASIRELQERQVPLYIAPRNTGFIEAAQNVAAKMLADGIDIALFQGGLTTPIDWLTARWAKAPVKIAIHTGTAMMTPGLDITLFDNPANIDREKDYWPADAGERCVLPKAVDIDNLMAQAPFNRKRFGIPDDAGPIIGTLSNALHKRLSECYMRVLAQVLQHHKNTWYLAFGSDPLPDKMRFFESMGVADRVRFGGRQSRVGSALKVLDIYASEFPVGGAQSVMEAMICGVPVVAMWWSNAHAESAGAQVVGPEFAIPKPDEQAYAALLEQWIVDGPARREAARRQQQRANTKFSAAHYVKTVCERGVKILKVKLPAATSVAKL